MQTLIKKIVESLGTKKFSNNTYSQNWWNEEKCWLTVQILKEEEEEKKKYMRDKGNSWWAYINQNSKTSMFCSWMKWEVIFIIARVKVNVVGGS